MIDAGTVEQLALPLSGFADASTVGTSTVGFSPSSLPCRQVDPELFFAESPADVEYAKSLCRDCPIQIACLTGALERHEPWGVWGGELFVHGEVVARKRPRGRPRKHPLPGPTPDTRIAAAARMPAVGRTQPAVGRTDPTRGEEAA